tara:strand:+ start:263 stop:514 length:252 start_codon:yes stop_codon:yes gene_type:complete
MLKVELSNTQISALELVSHNLENDNDFQAAAIELKLLAENISWVTLSHHLVWLSHMLTKDEVHTPDLGKISLKLLIKDIKEIK